jgi:hypothetical protein
MGIEDPVTDAAEQQQPVERDLDSDRAATTDLPLEADAADFAEQRQEEPFDDESGPR